MVSCEPKGRAVDDPVGSDCEAASASAVSARFVGSALGSDSKALVACGGSGHASNHIAAA